MNATNSLGAEMLTLRAAVAAHRELIINACEARTDAMELAGIPVKYGRYDIDLDKDGWRYPSIAEATRVLTTLEDDDGYYWSCSRLMDLERLVGEGFNKQLPLLIEDSNYVPLFGGDIPEAHPVVSQVLRAA